MNTDIQDVLSNIKNHNENVKKYLDDPDYIPVFLIKLNYNSGISQSFWCSEFSISGGDWSWTPLDESNKPLHLNADKIESVYQVGVEFVKKEYVS